MCCSNGKVMLAVPDVPPFLNHLLSSQDDIAKNFRYKIQAYNFAFTFTSTSAKLDNNLANAQSDHQTNIIPNSGLNPALIQSLKTMLDEVNPYMINLRYILRLPTKNIANLAMLIHADIFGLDLRTLNAQTASQVAAIWIDNKIPSDIIQNRDIVLHMKMDKLFHISEISACYDPLTYPILFPYSTNINEAPNNKEDTTELENSNEAPANDENSTIENNNAINYNISTKWHRKF
ncbi:10734_t:CDS:2, partial [Gigaspora rosea]